MGKGKRRLVSADVRGAKTRDEPLRTFACGQVTSLLVACEVSPGKTSVPQTTEISQTDDVKSSGVWPGAPIGRICSYMCFSYDLRTTDKRQKHTKIKCKRDESITKQSIFVELIFFIEEAFESYWRSLADKNKQLPKSTRRNIKSNKFSFGRP